MSTHLMDEESPSCFSPIMSKRLRHKTEAGQGGKLGHSNMAHWDYTEIIKRRSRRLRRRDNTRTIRSQLSDDQ